VELLGQAGRGFGSEFGRKMLENILIYKGVNVAEYMESLGFFEIMRKRDEGEKKCLKGERKGDGRGRESQEKWLENDYKSFLGNQVENFSLF